MQRVCGILQRINNLRGSLEEQMCMNQMKIAKTSYEDNQSIF